MYRRDIRQYYVALVITSIYYTIYIKNLELTSQLYAPTYAAKSDTITK